MLRVRDNNIIFAKGESVCPEFQIVMNNGMPFVMPYADVDAAILAFTVKSGILDDTVLTKYLDLKSAPIYAGNADLSAHGYCKFISQEPIKMQTAEQIYSALGYSPDTDGNNTIETPDMTQLKNRSRIFYCIETGYYYCWAQTSDYSGRVVLYAFEFQIPIFPNETQCLDTKEYLYDICIYIGKLKTEIKQNEFPLESISWKMQLLSQHKFILEDSNNV